jgi:hypothetical protein
MGFTRTWRATKNLGTYRTCIAPTSDAERNPRRVMAQRLRTASAIGEGELEQTDTAVNELASEQEAGRSIPTMDTRRTAAVCSNCPDGPGERSGRRCFGRRGREIATSARGTSSNTAALQFQALSPGHPHASTEERGLMATRDATERTVGQRAERTGVRLTGPAAAYIVSRGLAKGRQRTPRR